MLNIICQFFFMNCNLNNNTLFVPVVWVSLTIIFTSIDAFVYNWQVSCLLKNEISFFPENFYLFCVAGFWFNLYSIKLDLIIMMIMIYYYYFYYHHHHHHDHHHYYYYYYYYYYHYYYATTSTRQFSFFHCPSSKTHHRKKHTCAHGLAWLWVYSSLTATPLTTGPASHPKTFKFCLPAW